MVNKSLPNRYFSSLMQLNTSYEAANKRHILDILRDSLCDKATSEQSNEISPNVNKSTENEVRYKLIIDPSEDDSLVRLLFTSKCLERKSTHIFVSSDLPGDSDLQKVCYTVYERLVRNCTIICVEHVFRTSRDYALL